MILLSLTVSKMDCSITFKKLDMGDALQARAATGYTFWHLFFFNCRHNLRKLDLFSVLSVTSLLVQPIHNFQLSNRIGYKDHKSTGS